MSDKLFARQLHGEMVKSLFHAGKQAQRQKLAVQKHEAQEAEKQERLAALTMPQPMPKPVAPPRLPKRVIRAISQGKKGAPVSVSLSTAFNSSETGRIGSNEHTSGCLASKAIEQIRNLTTVQKHIAPDGRAASSEYSTQSPPRSYQ